MHGLLARHWVNGLQPSASWALNQERGRLDRLQRSREAEHKPELDFDIQGSINDLIATEAMDNHVLGN